MQAYELNIHIPENHLIQLPAEIPTGAARVVVLFNTPSTEAIPSSRLARFRAWQNQQPARPYMSTAETEQWILENRADKGE
jgi:hypothetical protein